MDVCGHLCMCVLAQIVLTHVRMHRHGHAGNRTMEFETPGVVLLKFKRGKLDGAKTRRASEAGQDFVATFDARATKATANAQVRKPNL